MPKLIKFFILEKLDSLKEDIKRLEDELSLLARSLLKQLKIDGICVNDLTEAMSTLPKYVNKYIYPLWRHFCQNIQNENLESLFSILNKEMWSILDYDLLEFFIETYTPKLIEPLHCYTDKVNTFKQKTLVISFIECWEVPPKGYPDYEEIQFHSIRKNLTLAELDKMRDSIRHHVLPFRERIAWMYYQKIKQKCILVSWLIPKEFSIYFKEKLKFERKIFCEYCITLILLGEEVLYRFGFTVSY